MVKYRYFIIARYN